MKKLLTLLMILLLAASLFVLASCGDNGGTTAAETTTQPMYDTTTLSEGDDSTTPEAEDSTTEGADTTADEAGDFVEAEHIAKTDDCVTITSLNGELVMTVKKNASGAIVYSLANGEGDEIVAESAMGLTASNFVGFTGASFTEPSAERITASYPFLGNFSELTDDCVAATVCLENEGYAFSIEVKLYDNGVAFRYNLPDTDKSRVINGEQTAFSVNNMLKVWYGVDSSNYESAITSSSYGAISQSAKLTGPLMIQLTANRGYVALMEGYVSDTYIGTNFVSVGNNTFKVTGSWTSGRDFDNFSASGDIVSGWRIINYSKDLGDIVNNPIIYHTALGIDGDVSSIEVYDWIEPGKSTWSWINDFSVPFDPQITYTLNAARLGFAYNIIDEGYTNWSDYEDKLLELGLLAEENNVKQILWCAVSNGHSGLQINAAISAKSVLDKITSYHIYGIKLDFFDVETKRVTQSIQEAVLEEAIARQIIVDFHGVHKPISYQVLYPNELTREGIRGLENMSRTAYVDQAKYFTAQYYTRLLSGHADFTPDVNTAMQIASLVVVDSPLTVIATAPESILSNPALEMIRAIPTVWDRTVFLDGVIGSYVSVAKEKDGVWYIGGISAANMKDVTVSFADILGEGEYMLTYWKDNTTTSKEKFVQTVTKDSVVQLGNLPAGCGYVMQITKLSLSQYGGEISLPISVTTASASSVVKYTIDGSDPMTSGTAMTVTGSITLSGSCRLRVAITEGDGVGTAFSHQFNVISYNGIESSIVYDDEKTTLTLTPTEDGAKIYYTTDGSTPSASSTLYTGPVSVTETAVVKAVAISSKGSVSTVKSYTLTVRKAISVITPDVYIGADYKVAVAGWNDIIAINKSMNNTTLSLGGTTSSNGTTFEHGISTNAIGYFIYDIPENATAFVGVVGIDDSAYNNTGDGYKASIICKITVDGSVLYTSPKLGQGEFAIINIALPEGASEIRIDFGDAGDGITCDNATLAEAGFILKD